VNNALTLVFNKRNSILKTFITPKYICVMQALITISDKQYLVKQGDKLFVPRQQAAIGDKLTIASLAQIDGANTTLQNSNSVQAVVLEHVKDEKVIVFKKKRRKRYQSRNGHRQQMTHIEVLSL